MSSYKLTLFEHKDILNKLKQELKTDLKGIPTYDWCVRYYSEGVYLLEDCPDEKDLVFKTTGYAKDCARALFENVGDDFYKLFWEIVLFEARNVRFDSYMLYLEKDREWKDKYYEPRRSCFMKIGLIQAIQDLLDDKLDLLTISLPPSTGKELADDTPVLTTNGWKNHGDLVVGDYVYGMDGKPKMVQYVFPKGQDDCLITFTNGDKIQCHENHEWVVYDKASRCERVIETKELFGNMTFYFYKDGVEYYRYSFSDNGCKDVYFAKIERVEPKQGNCIQVEDSIYRVGKTLLPTHNSTMEKFLHSAICGWFPDAYSLFYSHSGDITRMYYDGVLDILTNVDEYNWHDIFPNSQITSTNAKLEQINIDKYKPFPNVQCTSVGAKNAGKVRANFFLLCDDLIGGIEEAVNKNQLDKLWNIYSVDARQRKYDGCKEIHIATRWSVHDVIGRLQRIYEGNDRCRFLAFPDIDPKTGESNFLFDRDGFTVEFYKDQQLLMDDVSYRCLYKNEPIEREGLLYTEDAVRRYINLPDTEPDAIIGVCDAKGKGTDYLALPCMYQYGEDYYMDDCICDNDADYGRQYEKITRIIVDNNMQQLEIESNAGGDRVAFEVDSRLKELNARCNITTKPTETNKETRIIVNADWVKKHVLFKDKSLYEPRSDYGEFMGQLFSYSIAGKNPHDDVCDALANFALFVTRKEKKAKPATVVRCPW